MLAGVLHPNRPSRHQEAAAVSRTDTCTPRRTPRASGAATGLFAAMTAADVRHALATGFSLEDRDDTEQTALHRACRMGLLPVVETLLAHGAAVDAPNGRGQTPLHVLLEPQSFSNITQQQAILIALLQHRANPNAWDRRGHTPLHLAAAKGNTDFCERLIAAGGLLGARRRSGKSPADVLRAHFPRLVEQSPWAERFAALALEHHVPLVAPRRDRTRL